MLKRSMLRGLMFSANKLNLSGVNQREEQTHVMPIKVMSYLL
uniref:Uncharacterized protein n=1 Tax=Anguilla anguilla TaxID=7936 RepID=A0A0E9T0X5_ANGAN